MDLRTITEVAVASPDVPKDIAGSPTGNVAVSARFLSVCFQRKGQFLVARGVFVCGNAVYVSLYNVIHNVYTEMLIVGDDLEFKLRAFDVKV